MDEDFKGRRKHDELCDDKWKGERKEWVLNQICIATKGGKIWRTVMRPVIMLLLAGAIGGASITAVGTSNNKKDIKSNDEMIEEHHEDIKKTKEDIGDIKVGIGRILIKLEEHDKRHNNQ